jgi:hypothetical protein
MNNQLTVLEISMQEKSKQEKIFLDYDQNGFSGNWVAFDYKDSFQNGVIRSRSFDNQLTHEASFVDGKVVKVSCS